MPSENRERDRQLRPGEWKIEQGNGSFAWLESKEAERTGFFPPLFLLRRVGAWQTTHTGGKPQEKNKDGMIMGKKSVQAGAPHLIVDIKHSLLDLLVDLLSCVDESLREKEMRKLNNLTFVKR